MEAIATAKTASSVEDLKILFTTKKDSNAPTAESMMELWGIGGKGSVCPLIVIVTRPDINPPHEDEINMTIVPMRPNAVPMIVTHAESEKNRPLSTLP